MPVSPIEATQRPVSSCNLRPCQAAEAGDRFEDLLDSQDVPIASELPQKTQAEPEHEDEEDDKDDDDDEEGNSPASHQWILPSRAFDGLWDSLVFDTDVKARVRVFIVFKFSRHIRN